MGLKNMLDHATIPITPVHTTDRYATGTSMAEVRKVWEILPPHELGHGVTMQPLHFHVANIDVREEMRGGPGVVIRTVVAERDRGDPICLVFSLGVDHMPDDPIARREVIKQALLQVLEHELDELLLVDGERVADPHRAESMELSMRPTP